MSKIVRISPKPIKKTSRHNIPVSKEKFIATIEVSKFKLQTSQTTKKWRPKEKAVREQKTTQETRAEQRYLDMRDYIILERVFLIHLSQTHQRILNQVALKLFDRGIPASAGRL